MYSAAVIREVLRNVHTEDGAFTTVHIKTMWPSLAAQVVLLDCVCVGTGIPWNSIWDSHMDGNLN